MFPLKWQSDQYNGWYYENQNNSKIWVEISKYEFYDNFTQVAERIDMNGNLVVILNSQKYNYSVKLSADMSCFWGFNNSKCNNNLITTGYWTKKHGNTFSI